VLVGGALATLPGDARAQRAAKLPRVGYLWHAANVEEEGPYFKALIEGFGKLGYLDGRNIVLEHRFANETSERFKLLAAELVSLNVDVLMGGAVASVYLKEATTTIPIVFMFVPDPIALKLVDNLARPSGNITGLSNYAQDLVGKRLQFLKEVVAGLSRVALLVNPNLGATRAFVEETQAAAAIAGLTIRAFETRVLSELEPAFEEMVTAGMQAVVTAPGGTAFQWRAIVPKLAMAHRLPFCAFSRETFEFGALMSYGPDQIEMCRRSAVYADKILKGAKPSDLPVEQPTKFEFLFNLKTANALGLTIPPAILLRADEVIE
jgi:putative tryptophan/tyrosine transport system substrate-binding protein